MPWKQTAGPAGIVEHTGRGVVVVNAHMYWLREWRDSVSSLDDAQNFPTQKSPDAPLPAPATTWIQVGKCSVGGVWCQQNRCAPWALSLWEHRQGKIQELRHSLSQDICALSFWEHGAPREEGFYIKCSLRRATNSMLSKIRLTPHKKKRASRGLINKTIWEQIFSDVLGFTV